ncbi:uncharacterized protein LOC118182907 [Stegodyphus dumicola]|uniref:uncharacterized protein LOC118182907 n=1 Tax=Stegodyphus dumicola TaxID=202533 RepID=UPI0015B09CE3|nr:uncharacterized protein LOC118182907 [Stegodyphus dumicola]
MECLSTVYDWKYSLFLVVSLSFIADVSCLKCHQCFWSEITDDFKIQDRLKKLEDRKYPVAEPFIGMKIQRPPNKTEVMSNCPVVTCKYESDSCLKWSFVSNSKLALKTISVQPTSNLTEYIVDDIPTIQEI